MIRALFLIIKISLFVAVSIWIAEQTGNVHVNWMGYDIKAHIGVFIGGLVVVVLVGLFVQRLFLSVLHRWKTRSLRRQKSEITKGYGALTQSLSALAAGDPKQARALAKKASKLVKDDTGLSVLVNAQAAKLEGKNAEAEKQFAQLIKHKDTVFLGLRGVLLTALEQGDTERALHFAHKAAQKHPKHPWVLSTLYKLELKERKWKKAWETLKKVEKYDGMPTKDIKQNRAVLLLQLARMDDHAGKTGRAQYRRRQAHKSLPGFVPAALQLIQAHLELKQKNAAKKVFEACWKLSPHPELTRYWKDLAPKNKPSDSAVRLRWFEKLIALNPDSPESYMAAADVAIDDRLWGEAREFLKQAAEKGCNHARFYRLWAHLEESQGHTADAKHYYDKASQAPADKVWICSETGLIYDQWYTVAKPHNSFNTISWDHPSTPQNALIQKTDSADPLFISSASSAA